MSRQLDIHTCRHPHIKIIYSLRLRVLITALQSACKVPNRTVSAIMQLEGQTKSTPRLVKSRLNFNNKFKCNASILKCDQPKVTFSIQNQLVMELYQQIANYRDLKLNTPIPCKSLHSSTQTRESKGRIHELMNPLATVSLLSIQDGKTVKARQFLQLVTVHQTKEESIKQLMLVQPWNTLIQIQGLRLNLTNWPPSSLLTYNRLLESPSYLTRL